MPNYKSYIGVDSIYYALVTADTAAGYTAGTPVYLAPAMTITQAPKTNSKTIYADNQPFDSLSSEGETELELEITGLELSTLATLLGRVYDAVNGRMFDNGGTAPYCALGFRAKKSDGEYRYYWLHKGTFQAPAEEAVTQTDTPDPKSSKIKFTAIRTTYQWALSGSVTDSVKRVMGDTADAAFSETGWFSAVQAPAVGSIPALTCTPSPADNATGVVVSVSPTLTFNNALSGGAEKRVTLVKANGDVVAAVYTIDAAQKVITINPDANMGATTVHIIAIAGIVDVYGQAFPVTAYNFTTA